MKLSEEIGWVGAPFSADENGKREKIQFPANDRQGVDEAAEIKREIFEEQRSCE